MDSMNQLQAAAGEKSLPETVRDAAARLTTKVTEQFTSPFSINPAADSRILVDYFLQD
jgi:hypothetical protein